MRRGKAAQVAVTVDTVDGPLVPYDVERCALIVGAPQTNRITLSFDGSAVLDAGITLYPGDPPLVLSRVLHGPILAGPIRAISATAAQAVAYVETSEASYTLDSHLGGY